MTFRTFGFPEEVCFAEAHESLSVSDELTNSLAYFGTLRDFQYFYPGKPVGDLHW